MNAKSDRENREFGSFVELLRHRAASQRDDRVYTFLSDGENETSTFTFGQMDRRARAIAAALQKHRTRSERALLLFPPGAEFLPAFFGCLYAGVVAVPVSFPRVNRPLARFRAIVADAQPSVVLTTTANPLHLDAWCDQIPELSGALWLDTDTVEDHLAERWNDPGVGRDQLAFLQYTSGSTAVPKGVMNTHGNLIANSEQIRRMITPDSFQGVFWLPFYHDLGLIGGILQPLYRGGMSVFLPPIAFLQRPYRWLRAISRYRATISGGPNFAYDLCVKRIAPEQRAELDLSCWDTAFNGAEPIHAETLQRFIDTFGPCGFRAEAMAPGYGLAEATLVVSGGPPLTRPVVVGFEKSAIEAGRVVPVPPGPTARHVVACGQLPYDQRVVIVNMETGCECSPGQIGEVWVAGSSVASGYWNRPEETESTFRARLADSGEGPFLRTGDLGFIHEGRLYITGRIKDLIIIRGRNIYPQDIERTVEGAHERLRSAGCAAFSVDVQGEERLVVVQEVEPLRQGEDPEPIFAAIRRAVAEEHELELHGIVLIRRATLPKTSSGKIRRRHCREAFLEGKLEVVVASVRGSEPEEAATSRPAPDSRAVKNWLAARLSEHLGTDPSRLDPDRPLAEYGLGSVETIRLAADLEDWLGRPVPPTLVYDHPTLTSLVDRLTGLSDRRPEPAPPPCASEARTREPIAIIGIGCRFPGATGAEAVWDLLAEGRDAVGPEPPGRHPDVPALPRSRGGFLDRVDLFDAAFFGISPREACRIDPQQRLLLEVAWEALEDAGQPAAKLAGRNVGVFVGISGSDYYRLKWGHPDLSDPFALTGGSASVAANRLSYQFDFRGPSLAIDTACSGSLVAVHLACESLLRGEAVMALAGGVNLLLAPELDQAFQSAGLLAADGRCKAFDGRADGFVRSEGVGMVVLKPLSQALHDGDAIYAVIRGTAVNQDGRSNGLTAPSQASQEALLRQVCQTAGIDPTTLDYFEAHATGTLIGDAIEARALGAVLGPRPAPAPPCRIGTVKTNLGHLEAASGIAGLIKAALVLHHRAIPASLHAESLNPHIPFDTLPIEVARSFLCWSHPERPMRAGVNALGFGGTNASAVLEEAPPPLPPANAPGTIESADAPQLIPFSARSKEALLGLAGSVHDWLVSAETPSVDAPTFLRDLAFTLQNRRDHFEQRLALVVWSRAELVTALEAFLEGRPHRAIVTTAPDAADDDPASRALRNRARSYLQGAALDVTNPTPSGRFLRLPGTVWMHKSHWLIQPPRAAHPAKNGHAHNGSSGNGSNGPSLPARRLSRSDSQAVHGPDFKRPLGWTHRTDAQQHEWLVAYFRELIGRVLGIDATDLDPERPLNTLGLSSLVALELKNATEAELGAALPLSSLFDGPNLEQLATRMQTLLNEPPTIPTTVLAPAAETFSEYPLSYGQQSLWYLYRLAPTNPLYHICGAARVNSVLDVPALKRTFQRLSDRHAVLRTTYAVRDEQVVQRVHESLPVWCQIEDASSWTEADLNRRLLEEAYRPFDLERGPVFRTYLFKRSEKQHVLMLGVHHIAADFWSIAVLMKELGQIYMAEVNGCEPELPVLDLQYTDFVRWQAEMVTGPEGERHWSYWKRQLAEPLPTLNLPTDRPRPAVQRHHGAEMTRYLDSSLTERLVAIGAQHGASLYITLLAAFQVLLHRYSGQPDIIVGSPVAGRNRPGLEGLVGDFVNTVPMRANFAGNPRFSALLKQVRDTVLDGLDHQDFPFVVMVDRLQPARDASRSPIFQVMFVFQKAHVLDEQGMTLFALHDAGPRLDLGGLSLESMALDQKVARFDLVMTTAVGDGKLATSVEYSTDLFNASTIERLLEHYRILLEGIAANPHQRVAELPLLTAAEQQQLFQRKPARTPSRPSPPAPSEDAARLLADLDRLPDADLDALIQSLAGDEDLTPEAIAPGLADLNGLSDDELTALIVGLAKDAEVPIEATIAELEQLTDAELDSLILLLSNPGRGATDE